VFLAAVLFLRTGESRQLARRLAALLGPFAAALAVYLARNYVAYGSLQFRFGAFDWIGRTQGHEGWSRIFARAPTLVETWEGIGWQRVAGMMLAELLRFGNTVLRIEPLLTPNWVSSLMVPAFLPGLAFCGVPLLARRMPALTVLFVAAVGGSVGFICLLYTALIRYFSMLIPLFALWVSGMLATVSRAGRPGRLGTILRLGSVGAATLIVAMSGAAFVSGVRSIALIGDVTACPRATAWLVADTRPDERIMAFDPWSVAWATDREAIMIPSGGVDAIRTIARRYDAHWMLAQQVSNRPVTGPEVLGLGLGEEIGGLQVRTQFDDGSCRVYRLDWHSDGAEGGEPIASTQQAPLGIPRL
jgi:hypothetical protein